MGASSYLAGRGQGVRVRPPDASPGGPVSPRKPQGRNCPGSNEMSLPLKWGWGVGLKGNNPSCQRTGGGGFGPEGQLSQEPREPQNSFSKLRIFGPREKLSLRSQKPRNCPFKMKGGNSLMAQWLRIRLPVQGTRVQSLIQEDPTCRGATKPVRHNY